MPSSFSAIPTSGRDPLPQLVQRPPSIGNMSNGSTQLRPRLNFCSMDTHSSDGSSDEDDSSETAYTDNLASLVQQAGWSSSISGRSPSTCQLPPIIIPDPLISGTTVRFIMSQYEPLFELIIFKPAHFIMKTIKSRFIMRIISSNVVHWSMYLGATIFQSLLRDGELANIRGYLPLLDRFDRLCITQESNGGTGDVVDRLSAGLELAFLRYITSDTSAGYALVCRLAPMFLQLALADPSLWSRNPMCGVISLAHTLVSSRFELVRFAFMDAITSLILGVPPLINFDTSHPAIIDNEPHPMEWVHGCPSELIIVVVKINMWRYHDSGGQPCPEHLWRELEAKTWGWRPRGDYSQDKNSSRCVVRLAIQEGWRHTVLIYIYLGMCGLTSHDPRVQSSTQQISQLLKAIPSETAAGIHFWVPLVLAAICTRSEHQRATFHRAILRAGDNKAWLLRGDEFAAVLDGIWHGAAANGEAITWGDYINARKAAVRLGIPSGSC
ncbi:Fungal specific transcription factor domain [Ceratobasidium sp. AG-Ba]|nr:Fungal specific transcription factor domain [Ceratobasidium sp. AG-Ba]